MRNITTLELIQFNKSTDWLHLEHVPEMQVSQCSTVVRSTVVRAMVKVNGKHPILGPLAP